MFSIAKTTQNGSIVGVVVAALAAGVLLPNLGGSPLWDEDEPLNAGCSLAMWNSGDWIVPTFNGQLRVAKPALVNWVHMAGFAAAGTNETGARLGSAVLTILTCLLTWRVAAILFRPDVAAWAGVVMATFLWTGITGRAATPDAPLAFFTTLALWLFVRGCRTNGRLWRDGLVQITPLTALAIGAACGLAVLTKGPVGLVLPLAGMGLFAWWQAAADPGRDEPWAQRLVASAMAAWRGVRPGIIMAAAIAVAAPWYVAVSLRTDGEWLREFLLVHNVGRFTAPMEGHSGSAFFYYPLILLLGTFPWSVAAAGVALHAVRTVRTDLESRPGMRLLMAWIAAWVIPFSLAGTKLPGYVWPAYPAIACCVGLFVADWIRSPAQRTDAWMRAAWIVLAVSGIGLVIALPLVIARVAPGNEWVGCIGLIPLVGSGLAWASHSFRSRQAAVACWAATAAACVGLFVALGPWAVARGGGPRHLMASLSPDDIGHPIALYRAPPSTSFYASLVADRGRVTSLDTPSAVRKFVAKHPGTLVLADARFMTSVTLALPRTYRVIRSAPGLPGSQELVLFGLAPTVADHQLAEETTSLSDPSSHH